jgi:ASC-1-like (ASCH) protein
MKDILQRDFFLLLKFQELHDIKNGKSRVTGNIGYTRRKQTKQKHNTIYVGHHYTQTNTNNVNKP